MRLPSHPGALLKAEMGVQGLTPCRLAMAIGIPAGRISEIMTGRRAMTPDIALRLGAYFDTGRELWLTMQAKYAAGVAPR
jgi:addiction module HigA family antidote